MTKAKSDTHKQQGYYDAEKAEKPIRFIENLCVHTKGELAGKPLILQDWVKEHIRKVFGTMTPEGYRQYKILYIEVPRKNAKSTIVQGLGLYMMSGDGEGGSEVYVAAGDKEQARIIFNGCKQIVDVSPKMAKAGMRTFRDSITYKDSFLKVISAEAYSKHGFNAHCAIIDELHVQPNAELYDVLSTSVGARTQPLMILITTAGVRGTFAETMHNYAKKVINGHIADDEFYGVIYAADPNDDPFDEATWIKANPGYGVTVRKEYFKGKAVRAKNEPSFLNTFKQLHLDIWTNVANDWIDPYTYDKSGSGWNGTIDDLSGRTCYGGLDLSSTKDLTAYVLLFPLDDGYFAVLPHFFLPEESLQKKNRLENSNYGTWVEQGLITATPGNTVDYDYLEKHILESKEKYNVVDIGYDSWNSSQTVVNLLNQNVMMNKIIQGFRSLSQPTKDLEKIIVSGKFVHFDNAPLKWQFGNVVISQDAAGNIKADKERSKDKIDGVAATVNAMYTYQYWTANQAPENPYDKREFIFI
jgi:phage terminase large subunit-like protein